MLTLLLACSAGSTDQTEVPDDTGDTEIVEYKPDSSVCGMIVSGECSGLPEQVEVWTVAAGSEACVEEYDTGGGTDWRDALVGTAKVGSAGQWELELEPGEYAATTSWGACRACESISVRAGECESVQLRGEEWVTADAPNVYLYPEEPSRVRVEVAQPHEITASFPAYPRQGWSVWARPDGLLRHDGEAYDYLFYELAVPEDRFQYDVGWCAAGPVAQASVEDALALMGFPSHEIDDFAEYWDAVWPRSSLVSIYPQLDKLPGLGIWPRPDTTVRAWFVVHEGCPAGLEAPEFPEVERVGFVASEWGLILGSGLPRVADWQVDR